jgi:hypothetical protein
MNIIFLNQARRLIIPYGSFFNNLNLMKMRDLNVDYKKELYNVNVIYL